MDVGALLQHSQYAIPISIVLVCAILVFVFGFKNAEQPPFAQLTSGSDVDRKPAGKKRNKIKETVRAGNGQVVTERASPAKRTTPVKAEAVKQSNAKTEESPVELKERKNEENKPVVARKEKAVGAPKTGKENKVELAKNRKNLKNNSQEKPVDFDDGDWEQAYSRKEKKNKKKDDETPPKRNKKEGKKSAELISNSYRDEKDRDKPQVKDKVAKDTQNKELKEKDKKEIVLAPVTDVEPASDNVENKEEREQLVKNEKPHEPETVGKLEDAEQTDKTERVEKSDVTEKEESTEKPEKTVEKKSGKVKKAKKATAAEITTSEIVPPISEPRSPEIADKAEEKLADDRKSAKNEIVEKKIEKVEENNSVVFDELGDVWTEAKPQKKSKKKARKDN